MTANLNILIRKDIAISQPQLDRVLAELSRFYTENAGVKIKWIIESHDYKGMEKSTAAGIFDTLSERYMRTQCADIYRRHQEAIDHVIFLIHKNNWDFEGVWGENFSNHFSGYQTQVCRYDNDNTANSFGTIYHEMHHSHDAFIYKYTGKNIDQFLGYDWDDNVTHGGGKEWQYIRYQENRQSLVYISHMLQEAIDKRRSIWNRKKINYLTTIVDLLTVLLRTKLKTK